MEFTVSEKMRSTAGNPGKFTPILVCSLSLVLLFACGLAVPIAEADPCDPNAPPERAHEDSHEVPCTDPGHDAIHGEVVEVDGGRDRRLTLNVFPPRNDGRLYLESGDRMEIELEEFDLSAADFSSAENLELIEITDSVNAPREHPTAVAVDPTSAKLTLTLPDLSGHAHPSGEHLIIVIRQGTGILTPETPRGFDHVSDPYRVRITFIDEDDGGPRSVAADENFFAVRNPVSSTVPGEAVRIELATYAGHDIHGTDEITVDFSGPSADASFTVPETIPEDSVRIRHGERAFNPAGVLIQGERVTLTVPAGDGSQVSISGDYTITFSQSAEIKNPFSAGNRIITVSSIFHGEDEDLITAVIRRTTFVSPGRGTRGSEVRLTGWGHAEGTVTIFDGDDAIIGAGERLASVDTVRGAFEVTLQIRGALGQPAYRVWTLDSDGVTDSVDIRVTSSISFQPDRVETGSRLKITVSDWEAERPGVAAASVGGRPAFVSKVQEYERCFEPLGLFEPNRSGVITFYIRVPPSVPSGFQTVSVFGPGQLQLTDDDGNPVQKQACSNLEPGEPKGAAAAGPPRKVSLRELPNPIVSKAIQVSGKTLKVFPDSAARGQRITIMASGLTRVTGDGKDIRLISIGGKEVGEDPSIFEVPSNGDIAMTVTVPVNIPDGVNEVWVEGRDDSLAQGTLTVPQAVITVEPGQSGLGSTVRVTGTGFIANDLVSLYYGDGADLSGGDEQVGGVLSDAKANFIATFTVPLDRRLGRQHVVTAVARNVPGGSNGSVIATAVHSIPGGALTASPSIVCVGATLTIRGENLPPYAPVRTVHIGRVQVSPSPNTATDEEGSFEATVTVPHLELGNQTVQAQVSDTVIADVVEIIEPPLRGSSRLVFKELIKGGVLDRVWLFEASTQDWSFFDPDPEFADFTDLTEVESGDILWVNLLEPHQFQGDSLSSGWNIVKLD